jgi:hypothetical protein
LYKRVINDWGGPDAFAQVVFDHAIAGNADPLEVASILERHGGSASQAATTIVSLAVQREVANAADNIWQPFGSEVITWDNNGINIGGSEGISFALGRFSIGDDALSIGRSGIMIGGEDGVFTNLRLTTIADDAVVLTPGRISIADNTVVAGFDQFLVGGYGVTTPSGDGWGIRTPSSAPAPASTAPDLSVYATSVSRGAGQQRHVLGTAAFAQQGPQHGSYFRSWEEPQAVLDAIHSGEATYLGRQPGGQRNPVYHYGGVTGTNVNRGAGFPAQPTNVFLVKGTRNVAIVPYNPTFSGRP